LQILTFILMQTAFLSVNTILAELVRSYCAIKSGSRNRCFNTADNKARHCTWTSVSSIHIHISNTNYISEVYFRLFRVFVSVYHANYSRSFNWKFDLEYMVFKEKLYEHRKIQHIQNQYKQTTHESYIYLYVHITLYLKYYTN
jgi:hypothetical protein